jgi:hypothetical protein
MRLNPVFREGIEVYLAEGHGFAAYFYVLILLAPVVFLTLFLPSLDAQVWVGPAHLFRISFVAALVLIVYFSLRAANQEFAPWRFRTVKSWLHEEGLSRAALARGQLALLSLQVVLFVLLCSPLLLWAAAIARASAAAIFSAFSLLLFYAFVYGIWGLAALALWERRFETRQLFVRVFGIMMVFLTSVFYLPLNPAAFLLSYLGEKEMAPLALWGWQWPAGATHFTFHILLLWAGLAVHRWGLRREVYW